MYDVIGDVHGQGEKLRALLRKLGYVERHDTWHAPEGRKAVFVGDLIDRGPEQLEVLGIVRRMVEAGQALAVMGNHEFNAIAYVQRSPLTNEYFRPRSEKNRRQHERFLQAVGVDSPLHHEWCNWFRTLPMALDLGGLRVAHAWWEDDSVAVVEAAAQRYGGHLSEEMLAACFTDPALKRARKRLTCGVEMELPENNWIVDKAGHKHPEARLAVWRHGCDRLRDIAIVPRGSEHAVPDIEVPPEHRLPPVEGAPILFGHHWFSGPLAIESPKVACLDWSAGADGPLVAYRWSGESDLSSANLIGVEA